VSLQELGLDPSLVRDAPLVRAMSDVSLDGAPAPASAGGCDTPPTLPTPCNEMAAAGVLPGGGRKGHVTYLPMREDGEVTVGIFCVPAGTAIPMHNHPGMTVFSRCGAFLHSRRGSDRGRATPRVSRRAAAAAAPGALTGEPRGSERCAAGRSLSLPPAAI